MDMLRRWPSEDGSLGAPRIFLFAAAVLAAAGLAASTVALGSSSRLRPLKFLERCVRKADHARVVRFRGADRVRLLGVSVGRGPVALVLAHEAAGDLCNWLPFARVLARHG